MPIQIICDSDVLLEAAGNCAAQLGIVLNVNTAAPYTLYFCDEGVYLQPAAEQRQGRIMVDFCTGGAAHRRLYGGGKGQMIAKAVGVSVKNKPTIFDATAGLGGDGFVLACLGCEVTLMERSPVAFALLQDGLRRARIFGEIADAELAEIVSRIKLIPGDSIGYLHAQTAPVADVIYLDPMFPERNKTAAVKKEMQAFHALVGRDLDEEQLLAAAYTKAHHRIAVKRPRLAAAITGVAPSYTLEGKASRYDIYAFRAFHKSAPTAVD